MKITIGKFGLLVAVILVAACSYHAGFFSGAFEVRSKIQKNRHQFDAPGFYDFLNDEESIALKSGMYEYTLIVPGCTEQRNKIKLEFKDGRLVFPKNDNPHRNGMSDTMEINGNSVSWHYEGIMYESDAQCWGVVRKEGMWGHVYDWNPGEGAFGIWKIVPVKEGAKVK